MHLKNKDVKEWPCEHVKYVTEIRGLEFHAWRLGKNTQDIMFIPRDWQLCPICGSHRPKNKPNADGRKGNK
jgi:hypothetical protein